jgi:hypothetical protein
MKKIVYFQLLFTFLPRIRQKVNSLSTFAYFTSTVFILKKSFDSKTRRGHLHVRMIWLMALHKKKSVALF